MIKARALNNPLIELELKVETISRLVGADPRWGEEKESEERKKEGTLQPPPSLSWGTRREVRGVY